MVIKSHYLVQYIWWNTYLDFRTETYLSLFPWWIRNFQCCLDAHICCRSKWFDRETFSSVRQCYPLQTQSVFRVRGPVPGYRPFWPSLYLQYSTQWYTFSIYSLHVEVSWLWSLELSLCLNTPWLHQLSLITCGTASLVTIAARKRATVEPGWISLTQHA